MALPKTTKCTIDKLPEVQRRKVLDALLQGGSLRKTAELAGVSHQAMKRYRDKVFLPALREAQRIQSFQGVDKPLHVNAAETATLTRDIVQTSPFRDRLEKLWSRVDRSLDKAESAVRTKTIDGVEVWEEQGLQAIAPLMNQAHKNLELLGRVTGELEVATGSNIAIQIVLPQVPAQQLDQSVQSVQTIDIALPKRQN